MKIPELYNDRKFVYSFEIFPPKKMDNIDKVYSTVDGLAHLEPDFISVTFGAGGKCKDTLTGEIASTIKNKHGIETMAHLTCINSTKEQVRTILQDLDERGIENVMALRGDINEETGPLGEFQHANELAVEVQKIDDRIQILGACYPEGHYESDDLDEDIENLKYKIGAGAKALITQLFFDNSLFYDFIDKVRNAGIDVPVSAGIMPITNRNQIKRTVELSGSSLPKSFTNMIAKYENDPEGLFDAGIEYATEQIRDLIEHGVDGIHLYTMNNAEVAERITENISDLLKDRKNGCKTA